MVIAIFFPFALNINSFLNINYFRYDTDGYCGKGKKSSCEAGSVLLIGKSVCDGYANLMAEMCK